MPEPKKLGKVIGQMFTYGKCTKCKIRPKRKEGGKACDYCEHCIAIYRRKNNRSGKSIGDVVIKVLGERYIFTEVSDLSEDIAKPILAKKEYEDVFMFGTPGAGKTYAMSAFFKYYTERVTNAR